MARRRKNAYKPGAPAEAGHDVAALSRHMKVVALPSRLWTCAGPELVEAVETLVEATAASTPGRPN